MQSDGLPTLLRGKTERFSGNGRPLGYPTANIRSATTLTDGVYFGVATMDGFDDWPALIFIGTPVTVGDTERRIEAHLLDIPDKDYYGTPLEVHLMYYHRANQKFDTVAELREAMECDEKAARVWFAQSGVANPGAKLDT